MAWQPWSAGAPGVLPGLAGLAAVVNPAPAVLPTGSQYSAEQWAQMQQQNWQQWAQWQQQYQQWHQQYGAEYQKSITALSQVTQEPPTFQPPVPNTSVPPPLPKEAKPPLPPEEPPKENLVSAQTQNKNFAAQQNFLSTPPPNYNTAPPQTQNQPSFNAAAHARNQPPPNIRGNNNNFNYNRAANQNQYEVARNTTRQDGSGEKRPVSQPNFRETKKPKFDDNASQRSTGSNSNEDMSETEKRFVKQFTEWEAQFNKWKDQNMNHPDKEQYKEYEKKWEAWRTQLLERREQMRRRRLGIAETKPVSKTPQMPQAPFNTTLPPPFNKETDTTKPPPLMAQDTSAIAKEFAAAKDAFSATNMSLSNDIVHDEFPQDTPEDDGDNFLKMSKSNDGIPGLDLVKDNKDDDDDEKPEDVIDLDTDEANKARNIDTDANENKSFDDLKGPDFEAISKGINNILGDQKLLNMLSLVSQNQNQTSATTLVDTISNIPSNLDQSDLRNNENSGQAADRWSNPPDQQEYANRANDTMSNYDEQSRSSFGGRGGEFDWRDRQRGRYQGDFNSGPDDYDRACDNNFGRPGYDRQDMFRESDNFRDSNNFRGPDNYRGGSDGFRGNSDNFRGGPPNFRRQDNFRSGPDNFQGGSDSLQAGADNFKGIPDHLKGGPDSFKGGPDSFKGGPDSFKGGPDKFKGGPDNFKGGPDKFQGASDYFTGDQDNFRGPDNFRRGPMNFRGGPGPILIILKPDRITLPAVQIILELEVIISKAVLIILEEAAIILKVLSFKGGADNSRGGGDNFKGPGNSRGGGNQFRGGPDNSRGGSDNSRGFQDIPRGGPNFRGGQDNFRMGADNYRDGPDNFKGGLDNFRGGSDGFRNDRGPGNHRGSDNFGNRPDNFRGPGNFRGDNSGYQNRFEPPNDNPRNRFEPPNRNSQNFNRSDDFNTFDDCYRRPGDFSRGPNFEERDFGNNDFSNFRQGDDSRRNFSDQDKFRPNDRRKFDREPFEGDATSLPNQQGNNYKEPEFQPSGGNFPRGPSDFNRRPSFQEDPDNFRCNKDIPDDFQNAPHGMEDWSGEQHDFEADQNFSGDPSKTHDNFIPSEMDQNEEVSVKDPVASTEPTIGDPASEEKEEKLWQPTNIIEYDHKSAKTEDIETSLEPLRSFDYRHKPVNRIPFPHRPQWLTDLLRKYPEFDFVLPRSYDQPYTRYPERFERYPDTSRYENRWGNPPGTNRRSLEDSNRPPMKRFDDYGPNISRRPLLDVPSNYTSKKDYDRKNDDVEMRDDIREDSYWDNKQDSYRDKQDSYRDKQDSYRDNKQDNYRDNKQDNYRDKQDSYRDNKQDMYRDNKQDIYRDKQDNYRDNKQDIYRDNKLDIFRDNKQDSYRDNKQERDSKQDMYRESKQDSHRDSKHDSYRDSKQDAYRDSRQDSYRNRPQLEQKPMEVDEPPFIKSENDKFIMGANKPRIHPNVTLIQDLLNPPGRYNRPPRIVIILRGPPGSGKTFLAKLIKDKEVENGGSAPRILSLDDYFMVEQEKDAEVDGKRTKVKEMVYEFEECMENTYRVSLFKAFKKTITDGYFPFIIVDNVNDKVKYFGEMWSFAKQNGFQVYICQLEFDLATCTKRNIHNRSEIEIQRLIAGWEPTPAHHPTLDATSLIQAGSIPEVEMEEINSPPSDHFEGADSEPSSMEQTSHSVLQKQWKTTSSATTSGYQEKVNLDKKECDGQTWKNEKSKRK
ncbi:hypothetical protein QE152_g27075 [Popillia japonica]|uniref:YLP motif-containing protein 1 n=1 Tax=Popillia japonica TaxID=7064 RepID=A0AAW1JW78_POPJA